MPPAQGVIDKITKDQISSGELETLRSIKNKIDELNSQVDRNILKL